MAGEPIENGAVAIERDSVAAVGPAADIQRAHSGAVRDLGEAVLCPGLINAHCHLDYTRMRGEVEWRGSFMEWILQLLYAKQLHGEQDYLGGIHTGLEQLARTGTTTVINVECFPALIEKLPPAKIRVWWCLELIDFNRNQPAAEIAQQALEFIAAHPAGLGGFGLSPHAPYTASAELYKLSARFARARGILLVTHLAESQEEDDMFRRGTGPMYDYFLRAGRDMSDCKRLGVVQLLAALGVLGPNCLAVHANCLTPADVQLLARSGTHIVHCPNTHRFFQRDTPLLEPLWQHGANICLGTDSLASNSAPDGLNMFAEMQTLSRMFPRLAPDRILAMATTSPARALNLADKLGKIAPGSWADLIAVPLDGAAADPYEAVVYNEKPVRFSMVAGTIIIE
jgi:cytosine/adenosine deaminase-related metal-dependent hydrolase